MEFKYGNEVVFGMRMGLFGMGMRLCLEWKVWEWGY